MKYLLSLALLLPLFVDIMADRGAFANIDSPSNKFIYLVVKIVFAI